MKSVLNIHWKDWCWSWNSNTLATWCEKLTPWKRPWCWERLKVGEEGDYRGWDDWMPSPTWCTWVWVNSRSWWWRGQPNVLQCMGSQRVGQDWVTGLSWHYPQLAHWKDFPFPLSFRATPNMAEVQSVSGSLSCINPVLTKLRLLPSLSFHWIDSFIMLGAEVGLWYNCDGYKKSGLQNHVLVLISGSYIVKLLWRSVINTFLPIFSALWPPALWVLPCHMA